jgi:nucleoside-diphosphate-sugar epimerase
MLIHTILVKHTPAGIYNVISKEEISVREVVGKIINTLQIKANLQYGMAKRADESLPNLIMNTDKLKNLNVWNPAISIEDSIADYI